MTAYSHGAHSLDDYLSTVHLTRDEWDISNHKKLWFPAEDERHFETRLQPCLYRPRVGGKRKPIDELLELENDLYKEFARCSTQLTELRLEDNEWDPYFLCSTTEFRPAYLTGRMAR
jgi:hypothetical protein